MTPQYQINDYALKNYAAVLEQTIRDSPKGLPKGYDRLTTQEERIEFLEGRLLKKLLNRQSFYKITEK